jgi:uncharacterized protein YcbX
MSMTLGTVVGIWRYPVKSMAGERLERCTVGAHGIPGDRGWALRDEAAREIRGAKKLPQLLLCKARYLEEPAEGRIPPAEITLPDGRRALSDDSDAAAHLSELLGRQVTLWPVRPADDLDHYRRGAPDLPDMDAELRSIFGRVEGEPLPDLSSIPQELFTFTSIPGGYFDVLPLHLLTTATLRELGRLNPSSRFDPRRFRPNLLIETNPGQNGFAELGWCGRTLAIGGARVKVEMPVVRCVMTTLPQDDLPKDPMVLRTIVRDAEQNVGTYGAVAAPGAVAVGDTVELT